MTYSLLDLLLLGLELLLELVNQVLQAFEVLLVLVDLELKLAHTSVGSSEVLVGILVSALLSVQLGLELADTLLQLGDDLEYNVQGGICELSYLLSSLEGGSFSLIKTDLDLLELLLKSLAKTVDVLRVLLFLSELLGKSGGVGDGLLGALLSGLVLVEGLVEVGLKHGSLEGRGLIGNLRGWPGSLPRAFSWRTKGC